MAIDMHMQSPYLNDPSCPRIIHEQMVQLVDEQLYI